ncbi:MAG: ATP phosphoribosyltransferase regulatory subunit [Lachnospiraceae bacterium]|nr:ATP phosphoribosyltransferase regulatory subunit [Lachnospiraceae bacterium]
MKQRLLHTPQGVRDLYGSECQKKNQIKTRLHHVLMQYGYQDIETPSFEFYDIYTQEKGTVSDTKMYKFFDRNNNILVLRPDITPSIARSVAKYYEKETLPIRLSYVGNTYLNRENYQGKLTEFTEVGAELVNDTSSSADAEVIAMMIDALKFAGLAEFRIDIGQVEFYKGLIEEAGIDEEQEQELRRYIDNKNSFGMEKVLKRFQLKEQSYEALIGFMELYGEADVLEKAKTLTSNPRSLKAIERLEKVYQMLCIYGYEEYISFDLGMLTQYNYYTGIIFKGYTYGTGEPIAKGGRYDELLALFGKDAPSIGFVIQVDELMNAMTRQKILMKMPNRTLILFDREMEETAIHETMLYRRQGGRAALMKFYEERTLADYKDYCKSNQFHQILYLKGDGEKEIIQIG